MNDIGITADTTELVNLGPKEVRKRRIMGFAMIAAGAVSAAALSHAGVNRGWYLTLLMPFGMGTLALFQAGKKT
jgi:hypothetical protein